MPNRAVGLCVAAAPGAATSACGSGAFPFRERDGDADVGQDADRAGETDVDPDPDLDDDAVDGGDADVEVDSDTEIESDPDVDPEEVELVSTCEDPAEELFELVGAIEGTAVAHRYCRQGCASIQRRPERTWMTLCGFGTDGLLRMQGHESPGSSARIDLAILRMPREGPLPLEVFCVGGDSVLAGHTRPLWFDLARVGPACSDPPPGDGHLTIDMPPDGPSLMTGTIDGTDVDLRCSMSGLGPGTVQCAVTGESPEWLLYVFNHPDAPTDPGVPQPVELGFLVRIEPSGGPSLASCAGPGSTVAYESEDMDAASVELTGMSAFHECPAADATGHIEGEYLDAP